MTTDNLTVVGVFTDRGHAEAAMDALRHAEFAAHDIGFLSPHESGTADQTPTARLEGKAESGALSGAVTGGALGALAGAVAVGVIPLIGPVIAGGLLLGVIGGAAAAGAAAGTFLGPFLSMGMDETTARHYEREVIGGRTVVSVRAGDRVEKAADILRDHGAVMVHVPISGQPVAGRLA